jgi:FlaG/FlaF family flagellin (archaellin)
MASCADQIEEMYAQKFNTETTSRKNIGDLYVGGVPINVKSTNVDKNNYSPNLISAKRAWEYLNNSENKLKFLFVKYRDVNGFPNILEELMVDVEQIDWDCLTIQCQGNGVIQMCKPLKLNSNENREQWMVKLKDEYLSYIERQKMKLNKLSGMLND